MEKNKLIILFLSLIILHSAMTQDTTNIEEDELRNCTLMEISFTKVS